MKKTFMCAAAVSLLSLTPSFANSVEDFIKARDAVEEKMKALGPQIQAEFESHAKEMQLDQTCMQEIMNAQGKAENISDKACLSAWLDSLKAGKAMMIEDRPVFQDMKRLGQARLKINMKLIQALLDQKR